MTKEITKSYILQQLQDKFKLRELIPEKFTFSENVVPIYDIESHLLKREVITKDVSITSASAYSYFVVPQNEQWRVRAYTIIFLGAGAHTVAGVYIQRGSSASEFIYLDLTAGQTVSYLVTLQQPAILDSGDHLRVNIDGYTSTQSLRLMVDVTKEEVR